MITRPHSGLGKILESLLLNGTGFPHQSSGLFRPSEASVTVQTQWGPKTLGHCPRATWYRLKGIPKTDPQESISSLNRMGVGKAVENDLAEKLKLAGTFVDRNVPFRARYGDVQTSGEMDIINRQEPCGDLKYCIEAKSIYGYYAQKSIFGRAYKLSRAPGAPRDSYIMQTSLYLRKFSTLDENDPSFLPYGVIYVCDRGDGRLGNFETWLTKEARPINDDETIEIHKIKYASDDLDVPETEVQYSVEDILQNYSMIIGCLKNDTPPTRSFVREFNAEQVDIAFECGDLSKSAYEKWKKSHGPRGKGKETLGDWHCSYCKWKSLCQPRGQTDFPD